VGPTDFVDVVLGVSNLVGKLVFVLVVVFVDVLDAVVVKVCTAAVSRRTRWSAVAIAIKSRAHRISTEYV
jgi:hypothetical protein